MIPASYIPQVKNWKFGAAAQGDSDVKSYPLTVGGMDIVLNLQGCLSPFDPSSLNGGARKTLTLRLPKVWDEPLGGVIGTRQGGCNQIANSLWGEAQRGAGAGEVQTDCQESGGISTPTSHQAEH